MLFIDCVSCPVPLCLVEISAPSEPYFQRAGKGVVHSYKERAVCRACADDNLFIRLSNDPRQMLSYRVCSGSCFTLFFIVPPPSRTSFSAFHFWNCFLKHLAPHFCDFLYHISERTENHKTVQNARHISVFRHFCMRCKMSNCKIRCKKSRFVQSFRGWNAVNRPHTTTGKAWRKQRSFSRAYSLTTARETVERERHLNHLIP